MFQKLLQIISNNNVKYCLKIVGWMIAILAIIFSTMLMEEQSISFVYNNF